jgi:transcriptional regulator with XRE-family HTH domain
MSDKEHVGGEEIKPFCQMLIEARESKGLTVRDAEDGAHIPHGYLSLLEEGKHKQPSAHALYYLAKLYEIDLKPLLIAGGLIIPQSPENQTNGK